MAVKQVFYITQGALSVWRTDVSDPQKVVIFADDDAGIAGFAAYVASHRHDLCAILVDVIEEEFVHESIPKLGRKDRSTLISRRIGRRFRQTPYRVSACSAKANKDGEFDVVHSAITNHELVQPWMESILRFEMSLTGIFSVPLIAPRIFSKLFKSTCPRMFIARHQGQCLRQVFMRDGKTHSARLSKSPDPDGEGFAQFVAMEAARSRRYLERTRLLLASEKMDVCVVADRGSRDLIDAALGDSRVNKLQFLDAAIADKKLGASSGSNGTECERWYVRHVVKQLPSANYAVSAESKYWHMRRVRAVLTGGATMLGAACSIVAALFLTDAWHLNNKIDETNQQVDLLAETYRRENQQYDSIQADSAEMKLAVDTGTYILDNRVPVPWVMNQVGSVLSRYPNIRLRELRWESEYPQVEEPVRRRADTNVEVPIPKLLGVNATLHAEFITFDGDMRTAFKEIDALAADFEEATNFHQANAIEYPLDANTSAALTGEIDPDKAAETASFRIRIRYQVPGSVTTTNEGEHEII